MAITKRTLKAMLQDYHGFDLSDAELELVMPELENYAVEIEALEELDLSSVMSGRLLRVKEGR